MTQLSANNYLDVFGGSVRVTSMPTKEEIVKWLQSKHISMWGSMFLLEKGRDGVAADWILDQMKDFLEWRNG